MRTRTKKEVEEIIRNSPKIHPRDALLFGCTKAKGDHYGIVIVDRNWSANEIIKLLEDDDKELVSDNDLESLLQSGFDESGNRVFKSENGLTFWLVPI